LHISSEEQVLNSLSEQIQIKINGVSDEVLTLHVKGKYDLGMDVDPEIGHFGIVKRGESRNIEIEIRTRDNVPLPSVSLQELDDQLTATITKISTSNRFRINAKIKPKRSVGTYQDTIKLVIKHTDWKESHTIEIPIFAFIPE
jgi:hypothetical protein